MLYNIYNIDSKKQFLTYDGEVCQSIYTSKCLIEMKGAAIEMQELLPEYVSGHIVYQAAATTITIHNLYIYINICHRPQTVRPIVSVAVVPFNASLTLSLSCSLSLSLMLQLVFHSLVCVPVTQHLLCLHVHPRFSHKLYKIQLEILQRKWN